MALTLPVCSAVVWAVWQARAHAQSLGGAGGEVETPVWRIVAAFLLCAALAAAAAVALRARMRSGGGAALPTSGPKARLTDVLRLFSTMVPRQGGARRVELVERVRLNPLTEVYLLRYDDRELLVAATAQAVSVLVEKQAAANAEAVEP